MTLRIQYISMLIFKITRKIFLSVKSKSDWAMTSFLFYLQNISFKTFTTTGIPYISVAIGGKLSIDKNFQMHNGLTGNPIGRPQRCVFFVDKGAELKIGKNVGISSTALVSHIRIAIGDNVKIGGGVCIYDTDFHALDTLDRIDLEKDREFKINKPVIIGDNVFIGAHSTILKGVTIGENSIIGACSVVTKDIPKNEIWAGNPAKFIKKIN